MNSYNRKVKMKAMKKTNYSRKRSEITKEIANNKKNVTILKNNRRKVEDNTAKFIVQAELYYKLYKDLEFIISGVNKTNVKLRIKRIVDDIINRLIPSSMRSQFSDIKKELEELLKVSKLDVSEIKDKILTVAKNRIYNNILDKAEMLYQKAYFPVGKSYIKRAFTTGEIAKFLRDKNSINNFSSFEIRLYNASNAINKVEKVVNLSEKAIKVFDSYSRGNALLQQQEKLKTPNDYKEYYYKVAQEASKVASELKSFSSRLPMGMRDYYEFIFTVAESTDKMAKVVYDYTTKLETAMAECEKELQKAQESRSLKSGDLYTKLPNNLKGTNYSQDEEWARRFDKNHQERY